MGRACGREVGAGCASSCAGCSGVLDVEEAVGVDVGLEVGEEDLDRSGAYPRRVDKRLWKLGIARSDDRGKVRFCFPYSRTLRQDKEGGDYFAGMERKGGESVRSTSTPLYIALECGRSLMIK